MYTIKESSERGYFHEKNNRQVEIREDMTDEDFAQLVALDVKQKAHPDGVNFLRSEPNLERWHRALTALISTLGEQIAAIDDRIDSVEERFGGLGDEGKRRIAETSFNLENKKRKIMNFKFHVEKRLDDVSKLLLAKNGSLSTDGSLVEFYRKAIVRHKQLMEEYEFDPTVIDEALWLTLKGEWVFDDARQRLNDDDDRSLDGTILY
jgi:hypothetical protein